MNENLPTPPVETKEPQTTSQIEESLDYRDLLSSQIMAEQAKANASKYVMGGLQASGAAQTGVAQSVLSGIQTGYQNTIAQNINQFAMSQDIRQADQLAQTQSNALNTATTLLSEPDLTQDEYKYIYDNYYQNMSAEDQATFQFLYDRKGRELGFTADGESGLPGVTTSDTTYLFENFGIDNADIASNNALQLFDNSNDSEMTIGGSNFPFIIKKDGDFAKFLSVSKNWKNDKNGYIIQVTGNERFTDYYIFYKGRWMKADSRNIDKTKVSKKFKGSFGKIVLA